MRRTLILTASALVLAGCSSGTVKQATAAAIGATTSPAPATSTSTSTGADHTREALECGMFDMGAVYLNNEWPAIMGGHPRLGYALNLEKAADTWQSGLNSYSSNASLDAAIGRAESGIHDMETAMANSDGSAPVQIGSEAQKIQDAFTAATGFCADIGYKMTQPLASAD